MAALSIQLHTVLNCICSSKALAAMPRGLRGLMGVIADAARRNVDERFTSALAGIVLIEKFFLPVLTLPVVLPPFFHLVAPFFVTLVLAGVWRAHRGGGSRGHSGCDPPPACVGSFSLSASQPASSTWLQSLAQCRRPRATPPPPTIPWARYGGCGGGWRGGADARTRAQLIRDATAMLDRYCEAVAVDPLESPIAVRWADLLVSADAVELHTFDHTSDVDLAYFVVTFCKHCLSAREFVQQQRAKGLAMSDERMVQFDTVLSGLRLVASEWQRRTQLKEFIQWTKATTATVDKVIQSVDRILALRTKKETHAAFTALNVALDGVRTFMLLTGKQCNKRMHPTQWQLHDGVVSDLLQPLERVAEVYVALRFALKDALPTIANRVEEDKALRATLVAFEEENKVRGDSTRVHAH